MGTRPTERLNRIAKSIAAAGSRFHRDESGQVSLLVAILVLGIGVGCCFVGGVAERVNEKIEVQNAADAAAYSNALWAARGMNAVTAANHLMGELTALCVIHESLGAMGVERGDSDAPPAPATPKESVDLSSAIRNSRNAHYPEISSTVLGRLGFGRVERLFVEPFLDALATDEGGFGRHVHGAALYDAHVRIKELAGYTLSVKELLRKLNELISDVIDAAKLVPPVWTLLEVSDGLIAVAHVYGDILLFDLLREKIYLRGLGVGLPVLGAFKKPVRQVLIPAISQYAKAVVGSPHTGSGKPAVPGLVPGAQERTLKQLELAYGVTLTVQFPAPDRFRLPVVPEEVADGPNREVIDGRNWGGEAISKKASLRNFVKAVAPISRELYKVKRKFDWALKLNGQLSKWFSKLKLPEPAGKLLKLWSNQGFGKLFDALDTLSKIRPPPGMQANEIQPRTQNPTLKSFNETRHQIDIELAQRTQWVRAAYPHVDSFRAPLRNFFEETVPNSSLHTYFTHWTNRFTLIESHLRQREDIYGSERRSPAPDDKEGKSKPREQAKEFQRKLAPVAEKFAALSGGDLDDTKEEALVTLEQLDRDLGQLASWLESSGAVSVLESSQFPAREWLTAAKSMRENARETSRSAKYEPQSGLTENEYRRAVETFALYQAIEELLETPARLDELLDFLDPTGPPQMFVLRDALPENKGNEPWTNSRKLADEYFTLVVLAQRAARPSAFGPGLFKNPNTEGTVCLAQAMFYNANGRKLDPDESNRLLQPNTGWDTLNWEPPVAAPEWRKGEPSRAEGESGAGGTFPWEWRIPSDVFTGRSPQRAARVKLNWQSKLVPLSRSRIENMTKQVDQPGLQKSFEFLRQHGTNLITH